MEKPINTSTKELEDKHDMVNKENSILKKQVDRLNSISMGASTTTIDLSEDIREHVGEIGSRRVVLTHGYAGP